MSRNFFIRGPPEALEMDLSQEGPDQNFENSIKSNSRNILSYATFWSEAPLRLYRSLFNCFPSGRLLCHVWCDGGMCCLWRVCIFHQKMHVYLISIWQKIEPTLVKNLCYVWCNGGICCSWRVCIFHEKMHVFITETVIFFLVECEKDKSKHKV